MSLLPGSIPNAKVHHFTKHGHSDCHGNVSPTYRSWSTMKSRCLNPNFPKYKSYGAKGVTISERWMDFVNFLQDMGPRPKGTTLDRWPNKNGNYEPGNTRWATPKQQMRNLNKNVMVGFNGTQMILLDAAAKCGIGAHSLRLFLLKHPEYVGDVSVLRLLPGKWKRIYASLPGVHIPEPASQKI